MTEKERQDLLALLRARFCANEGRHPQLNWEAIENRLAEREEKLAVLLKMEESGGEPDVLLYEAENDQYVFCDFAKESPIGRRNLCYDQKALEQRKKNPPVGAAAALAEEMGIELLTAEQYQLLQQTGDYDTKTSSWIQTPERIRALGGALFCDKRYATVFVYHNSAESYYSTRGFRGMVKI